MGGATWISIDVLVVEDDTHIHDLLREALEDAGYSVTIAHTAAKALTALEDPGMVYAALVTDIRLGAGAPTGWDIARRGRELSPSLPIVYMTGDSGSDWPAKGVPNSVLITKPFAPAQVVTAVSQLLNEANTPSP